jgi:hypothetical protein
MTTFTAVDSMDRNKHKRTATFRAMTATEIRALTGEHQFRDKDGNIRNCRVTGALKTWKRDPKRYRLPVKYGMYESFAWGTEDHTEYPVYPVVQLTDWEVPK